MMPADFSRTIVDAGTIQAGACQHASLILKNAVTGDVATVAGAIGWQQQAATMASEQ